MSGLPQRRRVAPLPSPRAHACAPRRSWARGAAATAALLSWALACTPDEPVLAGLASEPILQDGGGGRAGAVRAASAGESEAEAPPAYEKPGNVWIDVRFLGGRGYTESRSIISEQLGAAERSTELPPGRGTEHVFERGTLRALDDRIYMLRIPLPSPMRRMDALQALGFPTRADKYIIFHREYRLNHEWRFRRIRLMRESPQNELVNLVEAWRWVPGEHIQRR